MSELGEVLKKARLEKNLTLDKIQDQTKIRKRYLEALEEGDYEALPGKFYVRAFIKNYAEAIGLDAEEVLKYYENDIPKLDTKSDEVIPARKPQRMRSSRSEKLSKILVNVLLWGFFILIIVVLWYYLVSNNKSEPDKQDNSPITQNSQAPDLTVNNPAPTPTVTPEPTPVVEITPTVVTFVEKVGKDDVYTISPAAESHTLTLVADGGDSWVEVYEGTKSGNKLHYTTMKNGDTKSVTILEGAYLVIGRPGYVKVTIDETPVDIGDSIREPKRVLIKKESE